MFRGISLGTTPRDPLGKSVVVMVMSRLEDKGGRKRENKRDWLRSSCQGDDAHFILVSEDNNTKQNKTKTTSALSIGTIALGRVFFVCLFLFCFVFPLLENPGQMENNKQPFPSSKCGVPQGSGPYGDPVLMEADASA